jgi:tetratricopeptide (TPR) repeat protein
MPLIRLFVVALFGVALLAVPARADDAATKTAKRHYERGEKLFALGKFDKALDEYQQAFDAKPLPDFLYNIGQCYRNLGDLDQAIFSFRKYLKLEPDAADRDKVEKLITDLEDKRDRSESKKIVEQPPPQPPPQQPPTPVQPAPPPPHTPIYKTWWFWTGVAVVAVGGSIGIYEGAKSSPPGTDLGNINFGR